MYGAQMMYGILLPILMRQRVVAAHQILMGNSPCQGSVKFVKLLMKYLIATTRYKHNEIDVCSCIYVFYLGKRMRVGLRCSSKTKMKRICSFCCKFLSG